MVNHPSQPLLTPTSPPSAVTYAPIARREGLPDRVKAQLLGMISAGELAPGDRLAPERELASEMGVSRNVVREAIRSLVDSNVLEARQGAGVFVGSLRMESLVEPLGMVLSLESTTLQSLAQARLAIEPGVAALAAERGSEEDLQALEVLMEEGARARSEDSQRFMEIDVELHERIVRMTDNPFLMRIMEGVGHLARSSRGFTNIFPRMREAAHADHERIVAALRARDAEGAREAMREHLDHVLRTLAEDGEAKEKDEQ
ncbi:MAG: GntR family transcriptional regulator, transcriptional repressor for pyruvate dehydrogenase complex [Thermoleophilaceae bacterium]|nr:GntR family transcriptional regulator, transcriptional repressor for pyruvate dehydrogenase complex [Thermoleophilaceae bacterium]